MSRKMDDQSIMCACGHEKWFHVTGVGCVVLYCGCKEFGIESGGDGSGGNDSKGDLGGDLGGRVRRKYPALGSPGIRGTAGAGSVHSRAGNGSMVMIVMIVMRMVYRIVWVAWMVCVAALVVWALGRVVEIW